MHVICFSHLRWDFVYQRPQHLLSRVAALFPVFYVEEPVYQEGIDRLDIRSSGENIQVLVPYLQHNHGGRSQEEMVIHLLEEWDKNNGSGFIAWFYTPMAINLLQAFDTPNLVIYDCMDELSAFKDAPAQLTVREAELMNLADLVFTGGQSLYEAKKNLHDNIHPFPSSIDRRHFEQAASGFLPEPSDQLDIPHPRIGFFGVLDERLDITLIGELAARRPDWQIVLIGPVVKINPMALPRAANIHYTGGKTYAELPSYLGGWDVALIPFAINESTRFISPTKTPEYLAGGIPVVSTPIRDVVNPYGNNGLVHIAENAEGFEHAIEEAIHLKADPVWMENVKNFLGEISWDKTWNNMLFYINQSMEKKARDPFKSEEKIYV